jgi:hypothetical protein
MTKKIVSISLIIVLVALFAILFVEKIGVTNFYTKPSSNTPVVRPVNDVKYVPATSTEQEEGEKIKEEAKNQINQPASNASSISVSLTAANQDVTGGPLIVQAIISGATNGTCKLTTAQNNSNKTYTANVVNLGTYYGCDGFSVPFSDLNPGSVTTLLEVTNSQGGYGKAQQQAEVK